jgi:hypothetical protein
MISRSSENTDNLVDRVDRLMRLVGRCLLANLHQSHGGKEEINLSAILDKLRNFSWNESEKKTVFCLAKLGLSYPNELKRLCGNTAQTFSDALDSLMKKELVEEAEASSLTNLKRDYLANELKTMPKGKLDEITFFTLAPAAKELFKHKGFEEDLRKAIGEFVAGKILREEAKFKTVIRQVQQSNAKQIEEEQRKKEEAEQQNRLSIEVDKLIIKHEDNFPALKGEIAKMMRNYPAQKPYLIKRMKTLEQIYKGERENVNLETAVSQAKRRIKEAKASHKI